MLESRLHKRLSIVCFSIGHCNVMQATKKSEFLRGNWQPRSVFSMQIVTMGAQ